MLYKKMLLYIVLMSWLFGLLDWQVIHQTRWVHRNWLDWMHAHETLYATVSRPLELVLCPPAVALKPVMVNAMQRVEASQEEQNALTHAPELDWHGFYTLHSRNTSWTFVPWSAWLTYWLPPSILWFWLTRKFLK